MKDRRPVPQEKIKFRNVHIFKPPSSTKKHRVAPLRVVAKLATRHAMLIYHLFASVSTIDFFE